jgi:putative membrane protein
MEQPELKLSDVLAQKRTNLAAQRNRMAANRTLMAWIRTAISFIGFGFTIYKFLQSMQEQGVKLTFRPEGPKNVGLMLLAMGTASMVLGIIEYHSDIKTLRNEFGIRQNWFPLIIAFLVALLGFALILSIVLAAL